MVLAGKLDANGKTITCHGSTVVNDGIISGNLELTSTATTISGRGQYDAVFHTTGHVTLGSNVTVKDYYFPTDDQQAFCYLNSYILTITGDYYRFSNKRNFNNQANVVSSGLRLRVHATAGTSSGTLRVFPISFGNAENAYSPVTISVEQALQTDIDEFVTFNVVKDDNFQHHPCLTGQNNLPIYWIANTNNNTSNKGCIKYHLEYNLGTINTSTNTNLALIDVEWKTYSPQLSNAVEFVSDKYSMPSGDFTSGPEGNTASMNVLYSSLDWNIETDRLSITDNVWKKLDEPGNFTPGTGDVLYIRGKDYVSIPSNFNIKIGKINFEPIEPVNNEQLGRLQFLEASNKILGVISGIGIMEVEHYFYSNDWNLSADYSEFDSHDESIWLAYAGVSNTTYKDARNKTLDKSIEWEVNLNHRGEFPNLHVASYYPDKVSYKTNIAVRNDFNIRNVEFLVRNNINCSKLLIGGFNGGTMSFVSGNNNIIEVDGDVNFDYVASLNNTEAQRLIRITGNTQSTEHNKLRIAGDIVSTTDKGTNINVGLNLFNTSNYVTLEFFGKKNSNILVTARKDKFSFDVKQLVINKDEGYNVEFTNKLINFDSGLANATSSEDKTLVMKSGEAIFNLANQTVPLSSGNADFVIPAAAKLTAKASGVKFNVTSCETGITLGGVLELNSGTELNNEGHLYYKETHKAALNLLGTAKFTNEGQFCPDPSSKGVIDFLISQNASVKIGGAECVSTTKYGAFVITSGSTIKMEENSAIHFVDGVHNDGVPDIKIDAVDAECNFGAGSKFVFEWSGKTHQVPYQEPMYSRYLNKTVLDGQNRTPELTINQVIERMTDENKSLIQADFQIHPSDWSLSYEDYQTGWIIKQDKRRYKLTYLGTNNDFYIGEQTVYKTEDKPSSFTIASSTSLPNVEIKDMATVDLMTVSLKVAQNLTIDNDGTLKANDMDMLLNGDFLDNGLFVPGNNTVYFCGSVYQTVDGKPIKFYNVTISNKTDKVEFINSNTIANELKIKEGANLYDEGAEYPIYVQTKYTNTNGSYTGEGGIELHSGDQDHLIQVFSNGNTSRLIVNNEMGVIVTNENSQKLIIDNALSIDKGILNMSNTTLTLGKGVTTVESKLGEGETVSDHFDQFDITKMIVFESTECGIEKIFAGPSSDTIVLPIGVTGKYTPVKIVANAINEDASFTIIPIDSYHSTITDNDDPDDKETDEAEWEFDFDLRDKDNALAYYWTVESHNAGNFVGALLFKDHYPDYHAEQKREGLHYVSARLLSANKAEWEKESFSTGGDEGGSALENDSFEKGVILFSSDKFVFDGDDNISGDYTAGLVNQAGIGAIPGRVSVYVSDNNGDWADPSTWKMAKIEGKNICLDSFEDVVAEGAATTAPKRGSIVYVYHEVTARTDGDINVYRTHIGRNKNEKGVVYLGTTKSHRLGLVSGIGKIVTESGILPRGRYANFVKPKTGTIEYAGTTGNYDVSRSTFNNVIFSGSGTRTLGPDVLIVNGDLTAEGDNTDMRVDNTRGATWNLHGNFIYNCGTFISPTDGDISTIKMCGDKKQYFKSDATSKPKLKINILEIDNSSEEGVDVNIPVDIVERVVFDKGVLNTSTDYKFTIINSSDDENETVVGYDIDKFINGPLTKLILTNGHWTFPVGSHFVGKPSWPLYGIALCPRK